ncbi:MAG: mechanosensitive ion channel [Deltaproteobacteria bacterium]|nr:mechanosensitive ion channel [Deltaproteobacteria bacterium]
MKFRYLLLLLFISTICFAQGQLPEPGKTPPPEASVPTIEIPSAVEVKRDDVQKYIRELKKQKKAQEKLVAAQAEKFEDAKDEYEAGEQEYQKIKAVSRDWDRRNKAEEDFLKSRDTFHEAQKTLEAAKLKLVLLTQELETLSGKAKVASGEEKGDWKFFDFQNMGSGMASGIGIKLLLILILILFPTIYIFGDLWTSFGAWFVIRSQSGFKRGDHIKLGTLEGNVLHIGFLRTTLLDPSQNHTIYFLNNLILKHPLIVATKKS